MAGIRDRAGNGKSGSLCNIQSAFRAHLAGIKETAAEVCCRRTRESWVSKSMFVPPVRLGERARFGRYEAHFIAEASKGARIGVSKRCRWKCIREAPLQLWANFRQRALDTAIAEIKEKTDLNISLESLERSKHRRVTSVTFAIKEQAVTER